MKKLLLLLLLGMQAPTFACNLCIGYDNMRLLRKRAPEFVQCNCNCQQQGISKHIDGHKCVTCGHRVIPYEIKETSKSLQPKNKWNHRTLKRYEQPTTPTKIELGKMFLVDVLK